MKRLRDNPGSGAQFKRPFGSPRGDSNGHPHRLGGGTVGTSQSPTTTDALTYLHEVKEMFQDQKEKYNMFLEIMKDFKAQRTDTNGVVNRMKAVFKGHNNLILGFNTFLPNGYEITLDEVEALPEPTKAVEFSEAFSFVNKIKRRFQYNEHVYKEFLDILNMYRREHTDINEVYNEVASIFKDHPDLLEEFKRFLPNNSTPQSAHHGFYDQNSVQRYNERSSTAPSLPPMQMDKRRRQDRIISSHAERNLCVDPPEVDGDNILHKEQKKHNEKESREKRNRNNDHREFQHHNRTDLKQSSEKQKSARKFDARCSYSTFGDRDAAKSIFSSGFSLFEKVKEKLDADDQKAFVNLLEMFDGKVIKRSELEKMMTDLLRKYPALLKEFNVFVKSYPDIESQYNDGSISRTPKLEDRDKEQRRENERAKEKDRYREKYMGKSIQELDLSACPRCTPSYRLLPDDYPIPRASQRSTLGAEVLNDHWVSVTSGSEDYSFKHMRRNQYEESLFRCEDDRFELDMLLESVSSTAKRAEELLNSIDENPIKKDALFCIEDYFTALNLRCIERIYGDHGLDVIDILQKNPTLALPIILTRLKQKEEEWTRCRSDFNRAWAQVYAENHYKSLDHRSFYFKQQDSKNLSTKFLVAEINDLRENKKNEDDLAMAIAARNRQPLVPHLECEYSDSDIHEDLYKLVKFSCKESCLPSDQFDKIMKLWTIFLEPSLHVPSAHGTDDEVRNDHPPIRCLVSSIGKSGSEPDAGASQIASQHKESASIENEKTCPQDDKFCRPSSQNGVHVDKEGCELIPRLNGASDDDDEHKKSGDLLPISEAQGNDAKISVSSANSDLMGGMKAVSNHDMVARFSNGEKEEGELSPADDLEDNTSFVYEDVGAQTVPKDKQSVVSRMNQTQNEEGMCKDSGQWNEINPGDEDSENASEAGEDASGSEFAGDECSGEERREEDNVEHGEDDGKGESEIEAERVSDGNDIQEDGGPLNLSEHFLLSARPLAKHLPAFTHNGQNNETQVFYGNDDFYVLFRLHHILYERILSAKTNMSAADMEGKDTKDASYWNPYARFMSTLYNLLDGSVNNAKFEDECRALIGNHSYVLFTLDKLICKLIKQLQTVATDEEDNKLLQLYTYEKSRKVGTVDPVYYENARVVLHEENIYRFEYLSSPARLSIQLMDNVIDKPEVYAVSIDPSFATYLYKYFFSVVPLRREPPNVMLPRNKRKKAALDEYSAWSLALEGVHMVNGLECKISSQSSKISYVLDTEDFFFRPIKRRKIMPEDKSSLLYKSKVQRFHKFLSDSL